MTVGGSVLTAPADAAERVACRFRPWTPWIIILEIGSTIRRMKLYPTRCLVPAVWLKHQPAMESLVRIDRRRGAIQIQWRGPRREDGGRLLAAERSLLAARRRAPVNQR